MTPFHRHLPTALRTAGLLAALAMAGAAQASSAFTVKIEDAGFTTNNNFIRSVPGFGNSGPVSLNWDPFATDNRALLNWRNQYSGRDAAYCGITAASLCTLDLTVDSGFSVTLDSFWFGSFGGANRSVDWSVVDLDGGVTVASGPGTAVGAAGTTVNLGLSSTTGFRILFSNDGVNNGINDIVYRSAPLAPIPEPGSWALALNGLGVVGAVMRRRRRA
jgi:hypothetical protein